MKKNYTSFLKKSFTLNGCVLAFFLCLIPALSHAQHMELEEARQLAISKQYADAEIKLGNILTAHPEFLPAKLLRAHNYSWWRKYDLAINAFRSILRDFPENKDALIGLGYAYAWSGDTPKALYPFQLAMQKHNNSEEARKGLGNTYLIAGNGKAAKLIFQDLATEFPEKAEYYIGKGQSHLLLDQTNKARQAFQRALELEPNNTLARDFINRSKTESSLFDIDAWGGYSIVGNDNRVGLRFLQASWQIDPRYTAYARYDNSLSLDNIDFIARRQGVASTWAGAFAGWNRNLASRLEYGLRFFPDQGTQHLIKAEQVFYTRSAVNFKLGGFLGNSSDTPTEWFLNSGIYIPINDIFSLESTYFYSRDGNSDAAQHRGLLSAKVRHPKGFELTIGGFYGKPNIDTELLDDAEDRIRGGYIIGLFPFSKFIWGQVALNREMGVFENSTVFAAGIKVRIEK